MNQSDPSSYLLPSEIIAANSEVAPIDVDSIATQLGLFISYEPMGDLSGKIERLPAGGFKIAANTLDPRVRQRFTVAHEIGHYILHRDMIGDGIVDDAMYRSRLRSELETQANQYAANLLMPAHLIKREWKIGPRSYVGMAAKFGVSPQAMEIRMKTLGIE